MIKTKRYIFLTLLIFLTTFNPELPLLKLGFFIIKTVNVSGSKNTDIEKLKKQFNFLLTFTKCIHSFCITTSFIFL